MAWKRIQPRDALPADALVRREGLRLLGTVAALLAAALLLAAGLLWREHARTRPHAPASSVSAVR